jgi:DNA-binding HxlR family transcriptional regulator
VRIHADPEVEEPRPDAGDAMPDEEACLTDPDRAECPVCGLIDLMGRKWTLHLVWTLREEGPMRFNELERQAEGISPRVLSDRLDELVGRGLVERRDHDETPPHVEYELTPKGEGLDEVLEAYRDWADTWGAKTA